MVFFFQRHEQHSLLKVVMWSGVCVVGGLWAGTVHPHGQSVGEQWTDSPLCLRAWLWKGTLIKKHMDTHTEEKAILDLHRGNKDFWQKKKKKKCEWHLQDWVGLVKNVWWSRQDWSLVSGGLGMISLKCLQGLVGLAKSVCMSGQDWPIVSASVGKIDHDCLEQSVGLDKSVCNWCQDWPDVCAGVDRIGQVCLQELVGLVRCDCSSGLDWSRASVSIGAFKIGQECLQEWAGLVKRVWRNGQDWSRVSAGIGRIGWVSARVSGIGQEYL